MQKDDVHVGLNGWLFLVGGSNDVSRFYTDRDYFSEDKKEEWIRNLSERQEFFEKSGISYRHISAPEKISIYPEYLNRDDIDISLTPVSKIIEALKSKEKCESFIDVRDDLRGDKSPFGTYFKTDTHWNLRGAFIVLRKLCCSLGLEIDDDFGMRELCRWKTCFDLGSKLEPKIFEDHLWVPYPASVRRIFVNDIIKLQEKADISGSPAPMHHGAHAIFANKQAKFDRTVVIFGDSFADHRPGTLTALFSEYFRNVHFCFSHHIDRNYCIEVGADIVISEIAERFMRNCPGDDCTIKDLARRRLDEFYATHGVAAPEIVPSRSAPDGLRIVASIRMEEAATREIAYVQGVRPNRRLPNPVFPGQDMSPLIRSMIDPGDTTTFKYHNFQKTTLYLYEVKDAYFIIENGLDNIVMDRNNNIILESSWFRSIETEDDGSFLCKTPFVEGELDDVFLGWDSAWHNYYHFLCLGIGRSFLANPILGRKTKIIVPDYASRKNYSQMGYGQDVYDQALHLSGLTDRVTKLPVGIYKAKRIRFFWPDRRDPTFFDDMTIFDSAFDYMRRQIPTNDTPRKLFLSREKHHNPRMTGAEIEKFDERISKSGFEKVYFEQMSLLDQATLLKPDLDSKSRNNPISEL